MITRHDTLLRAIVLALGSFSSSQRETLAWTPHALSSPLHRRRQQQGSLGTRTPTHSSSSLVVSLLLLSAASTEGPFFGPEEEFLCPDEDECEIDWDKMPEFASEDNDVPPPPQQQQQEDESDIDLQPRPTYGSLAEASLDRGRVRLEMNWQIEECETAQGSCTDFCLECAGSGRQPCRFCRGTGVIVFGTDDFRPCLICCSHTSTTVGQEDCSACRGTGQIAPWASTMNEHFQMKADEEEKQRM